MKITILALFAMCLCTLSSFAQNTYSVKGAAVDTASMAKLTATVTVLNAKDSTLVNYTHAINNGLFSFNGLPAGKYLLLVTYPDYADYVEGFTLDPLNKEHDFGNINMQLKLSILKEVIIKGDATAIELHGDTTVFNARAYITQPNAKVEELLKQFPGVEIDSKGKIKANGEEVKKVLVDGEEFFGDDPTLVTRNLRADMVDKVELFDKKTDQAAFTGIDDGKTFKAMNVILKEDKKKGVFGKVAGGAGTNKYYEGQGIFNKFTATTRVSVYGTTANDGTTSLGSADNSKIGVSDYDGDFGNFGQRGVPVARNGGAHFDTRWDKGLQNINSNYRLGSLGTTIESTNLSQQSIPGSVITNSSSSNSYTYLFSQRADGLYGYNPNPGTQFRLSFDGAIRNNESRSSSVNRSSSSINGGPDSLRNINTTGLNSKSQQKSFDASVTFNKRLKKPRRTISFSATGWYDESGSKDYRIQDLYTASTSSSSVTDQFKPQNTSNAYLNTNLSYTEPITKKLSAIVNYGIDLNNNSKDLEAYNPSLPGSGNYDILDTAFSSNYKFNQFSSRAGLKFSYSNGTKTTLTFGATVADVNYKQVDVNRGQVLKRGYTNWNPQAQFRYAIGPSNSLSVTYSGNNSQPTINQIQPVKNNDNVTTIFEGNAGLKASFRQYIRANYNKYTQITNTSFGIYGSFSTVSNNIVQKQTIDANNISTIQFVNLAGKTPYNYSLSVNKDRRTKLFTGSHLYFTLGTNGIVNYNYVNGVLDKNSNEYYELSARINRIKKNKHTVNVTVIPNYSFNTDQLQSSFNYHAWGFKTNDDVTIFLTKKLQLFTELKYSYWGKTRALPARNYTILNAALSETFLKEDNLKVSLSGNNLLDQNLNTMYQNGSTISQNTYNSIKRYFMLSVSWDFTKFGKTAEKK